MKIISGYYRIQEQEKYDAWIKGLPEGSHTVLYQAFHPYSNMPLDVPSEYWCYYLAQVKVVEGKLDSTANVGGPRREGLPIRPDGLFCYWNSDDAHGDCFASRIVPVHSEILDLDKKAKNPMWDNQLVIADRPVCCPEWEQATRFVLLNKFGPNHYKRLFRHPDLLNHYSYRVDQGEITVVYTSQHELLKQYCQQKDMTILYSESRR